MVESGKVTVGLDPGGVTGVHDTDCPSLEMARVPSCFLYAAEPLGGAMSTPFRITEGSWTWNGIKAMR